MATNGGTPIFTETDNFFDAEDIFDLRTEFANLAIVLGKIAKKHGCMLALSVDPFTPRMCVGSPEAFREFLLALVDHSLATPGAEIINIRLGCLGRCLNGRHRLEITVTTNGTVMPPRQMTLFNLQPPPSRGRSIHFANDMHAMLRLNTLIRRLDGSLQVEEVLGWGPRYVARFQLPLMSDSPSLA